jgi:hypothetical protein
MTRRRFPEDYRFMVVAPAFLEWDLGTYVTRLLAGRRLGVARFAYRGVGDRAATNEALLAESERVAPDVVLGLKMGAIEPETVRRLRARGARVVLWYVDCFSDEIPRQIGRLVPEVDVFLSTAAGMVPKYAALGATPVHWVVEGAYLPAFPDVDVPAARRPLYGSRVAFVGNIFHPPVDDESLALRRFRLLSRVCERFDLKVWGPQGDPTTGERWGGRCPVIPWPAYHEEFVKICRASDVVLGVNTINTVERYFSNRTFLTLASGGFHLTHYVPGLETMFANHEHLVWFRDDDECLELIDHYLRRPDERRRIAAEGRRLVRDRYGMDRQVDRILAIVGEHLGG